MLNKELCVKCHRQANRLPKFLHPDGSDKWEWYYRVACVKKIREYGFEYSDIHDDPPDDCPYHLEHILKGQK